MGVFAKSGLYFQRIWELLTENPREANTEGGLFPAIFGTYDYGDYDEYFCGFHLG